MGNEDGSDSNKATPEDSSKKANPSVWDGSIASAITKPVRAVAEPVKKATNTVVIQPVKTAANAVTKPIQAAVVGSRNQSETKTNEDEESPEESSLSPFFTKASSHFKEGTGKMIENLYKTQQQIQKKVRKTIRRPARRSVAESKEDENQGQPALPPDEQLESMDVIITKKLQGVSIKDFYETCWSEGNRTDKKPFYGPWLVDSGKLDIKVEDWQFAEEGADKIVGEWDKEEYDQKRTVTFQFERTTALYTGPPIADVKQTHYCRRQGDDRCIVSITVEMDGIPFSDAFNVQIRWVATRIGKSDLSIKVGLFVVFLKQVIVAGKIKSGTTTETTKTQVDLFKNVKKACGVEEGAVEEEPLEEESNRCFLLAFFQRPASYICYPFFHEEHENDVVVEIQEVRNKLKIVKTLKLPDSPEQEERRNYILSELKVVRGALDGILLRELQLQESYEVKRSKDQKSLDGFDAVVSPLKNLFGHAHNIDARNRLVPRKLKSKSAEQSEETNVPDEIAQSAPDEVLQSMDVVISKTLPDASIQRLYEVCFSEGNETNEEPFYGPWLESTGKDDVQVGDWEFGDFVEDWSKESYQQKRNVSYQFKRAGLVGQDPMTASVQQTQYCRIEKKDKLVVATLVETSGVPFSDTFLVHIRWVVTRSASNELLVKVGLFVLFMKQTLVTGKIRAATTQENTKLQLDMFKNVKKAFGGTEQSIHDQLNFEDEEAAPWGLKRSAPHVRWIAHPYSESTVEDDEELAKEIKLMERKLRVIDAFLADEDQSAEEMNFVLGQLVVARETLDDIVLWQGSQEEAPQATA